MDLSTLEIFIEVMRQGSFAAVARERNVDPSAISRTIAGLEKELGVRLFQRTTRQLSPTEEGATYFGRVEPLVEELQHANELTVDLSGQPKGELRVTTSVSFGLKCVVPLLPAFSAAYPELAVDLLFTDAVVDLVAERVDLAVRLGVLPDSTLIAQRLTGVRYRVCASPDYVRARGPLAAPAAIADHESLLFPLPDFRTRWIYRNDAGDTGVVAVQGRTVISNALALLQCAVAGMGLTLLPHWLVDDDIAAGRLVDLFPEYEFTATDFGNSVWFVYPSRAYVPLKVRLFIDFFQQSVRPPDSLAGA